jgi:hypothetical protein
MLQYIKHIISNFKIHVPVGSNVERGEGDAHGWMRYLGNTTRQQTLIYHELQKRTTHKFYSLTDALFGVAYNNI